MTLAQSLKLAAAKLTASGLTDTPRFEAEILLAQIIKKPLEFIMAHEEKKLTARQISSFKFKISGRLKGLPLAYLTGQKEFYGLNFKVNKNVLIPRPETELMVEEALRITHNTQHATIVDVGAGSGCIIITLAKLLESGIRNYELWGIDISKKALIIAKQNARAHGVYKNIKFLKGNLLTPLIHNSLFIIHNSLIILANLPYGWKEWKNNSSADTIGLKFEPPIALYTGKNGLELYEKLFKKINYLIRNTKYQIQNTCILCEFDPRQTAKIKRLIKRELPEAICQIKKDLSGLNRLAIIKITSPWQGEG